MINILIVDDNPDKLRRISECLTEADLVTIENIKIATDSISAKRALEIETFDVMLLDIQIPNRIDQAAKPNGGITLLQELQRVKKYRLPSHIIGITAYDESYVSARNIFNENLFALVKCDITTNEWLIRIKNYISYIDKSKDGIIALSRNYDYDVAICCALFDIELESILRLGEWECFRYPNDSTLYYRIQIKSGEKNIRVVASSANQMGMTSSSVLCMKLIYNFTPRYLIMSGIAAGVRGGNRNIGDILIADPSWDYGSGKITDDGFLPDPLQIRMNSDLRMKILYAIRNMQLFHEIYDQCFIDKPGSVLRAHIGPLASGSSVLTSASYLQQIIASNRKLIGIDMETYGVLYAADNCTRPKPQSLSIKSICDFADIKKDDRYQRYAAYTSSKFIFFLIRDYLNLFDDINDE